MTTDVEIEGMNDDEFDKYLDKVELEEASGEAPVSEETEEVEEVAEVAEKEEETSNEEPEKVENTDENEETSEEEEEEESETSGEEEEDNKENGSELDELFKPFKANGSEMSVKDINEARTLMQMGANYSLKMSKLKPNLRRIQTLETNEVSDEDINLLIDAKKGDLKAIRRLLTDAKVDPLDIDLDEESEYKGNSYQVTEQQFDLDSAIEEIKETDSYEETINIVGNIWDDESRSVIASKPEILSQINDHVANGDYAIVNAMVQKEKALGRLTNVNDIDAYAQVYHKMYEQKAEASANSSSTGEANLKSNDNTVDPKKKVANKKAAASTSSKAKPSNKGNTTPDINKMSDEEFDKYFATL